MNEKGALRLGATLFGVDTFFFAVAARFSGMTVAGRVIYGALALVSLICGSYCIGRLLEASSEGGTTQ